MANEVKPQHPVKKGKRGTVAVITKRREQVWNLLVNGKHTYREIAAFCHVDVHTAHDDVKAVMKQHNDRIAEMCAGYVAMQDAELRQGIEAVMADVVADSPHRFDAIDRLTKLTRELAKLHGLDKPIKVAQTDPSGEYSTSLDLTKLSQETLEKLLQELGAK